GVEGAHIAASPPACEAPWCGELDLDAPLEAGRTYFVRAGADSLPFVVAGAADHAPPQLVVDSIAAEGNCAAVRLYADEPITAELRDAAGHSLLRRDVSALAHELAVRAPDRPPLVALVADLAGNSAAARIDWNPPSDLPALAITEVMAHPLGVQPAQEWIELENRGSQTVPTAGLVVAAAGGSDPLPSALIPPDGFAVVA